MFKTLASVALASFVHSMAPAFAADAALIAAAKKEGVVNWYTTQIVNQFVVPAAAAFEKKYGIKVTHVRSENAEVMLRLMEEAKAGKVVGDVFDGTSASALVKAGLVLKWQPDMISDTPAEWRDPNGYWSPTNIYVLTPGINTNLVPKGSEPKGHLDLLDPKWKGKIVWAGRQATSAAPGFIGSALAALGDEKGMAFLRDLSKQNVAAIGVSARVVLDQVIAGEYAIALNIFNSHPVISAQQGAPTTWLKMQPAMGVFSSISITKDAPHPNASKLFIEYLMSEEGQAIFRDADYTPVNPNVAPRIPDIRADGVNLKAIYYAPEKIISSMPRWVELFKRYFR